MTPLAPRIALVLLSILFILTIAFKTLYPDREDPYRCNALLNTGRWIDFPDSQGSRQPYRNWQPDGCKLHQYTSEDIRQCMDGRHIVVAGDSTARQTAYGILRLLERGEAIYDRAHHPDTEPFNISYHGVEVQEHLVRWLENNGDDDRSVKFLNQLDLIRGEDKNPSFLPQAQKSPGLVFFSVGPWYADPSHSIDFWQDSLSNVTDLLPLRRDFVHAPMDPVDGIGNHVFMAPPAGPYYIGDDKKMADKKAAEKVKMEIMASLLRENDDKLAFHSVWSIFGLVQDDPETWVDPRHSGFHVIDTVAEVKAQILLNLRCNARLDRIKGYPFSHSCCTDYGPKPQAQLAVVGAGMLLLVACILGEMWDMVGRRESSRSRLFNMTTGSFVLVLLLSYFTDRTHLLFAKGSKVWAFPEFALLCTICLLLAIATVRKSSPPRQKNESTAINIPNPDQPFLSRDQTDEWKGWMQAVILVYHWVSAAKSPAIFVFVRLLVAAYLFQTGYGHTIYFLTKRDFSARRVVSVLLRLNLLPCALAYVMNTDYMFYYFSPLVSFWFLVVYFTLAYRHETLNDDSQLVLSKICVSIAIFSTIVLATPLMEWIFALLRFVFHIRWSLVDWEYRVKLDLFVVYTGMLSAMAYLKVKDELKSPLCIALAILGGVLSLAYMFSAVVAHTRGAYSEWHAFSSFVPILAFIAIRNISARVRNYHSRAMAWLGRCSLETYTLQFHLFLAGDTDGVLVLDGLTGDGSILGDRWRSLVVIVPLFLWLSSLTATATNHLVQVLLGPTAAEPSLQEKGAGEEVPTYGGSSTMQRFVKKLPSRSAIAPYSRVLGILAAMWLLNLVSPMYDSPIPDGPTLSRMGSGTGPPLPQVSN